MGVLRLSLGQSQASKVAKLLSNDTASKIMDALSADSKSESELAKELDIPLSTVHYNVQKLTKAGILSSDEFTYSEKGKEVRHYRLASEHIVITTKPSAPLPELATGGVLVGLVAAAVAYLAQSTAPSATMSARTLVADSTMESAAMAPVAEQTANPAVWPYVLLGAAVMFIGLLVVHAYKKLKK